MIPYWPYTAGVPLRVMVTGETQIAAGGYHTCGISATDHALDCWGDNNNGDLGQGDTYWRYYVSQAILQGRKQEAGSVARVSASDIEAKVLEVVRAELGDGAIAAEALRVQDAAKRER